MTYADGLSDINLNKLVKFHKKIDKMATVTAIKLRSKFDLYLLILKIKLKNLPRNQLMKNG